MASRVSTFRRDSLGSEKTYESKNVYALRMNSDRRTEMYVKFAKVMIIFQGPVTDKRSQAVSTLASKFKHSIRIISDETYKSETHKHFEPESTEEFYEYFRSRAKKACEDGYNLIVIDPSMSNADEIKYYFFLAQTFQYVVLPVPCLVTGKSNCDEESSGRKQRKRIDCQAKSFANMRHPIEHHNLFKHLYCGWFLHDIDSRELREEASLYIQDCFEIKDFEEMMCRTCNRNQFKSHYKLDNIKQDLASCIVKIFSSPSDMMLYMSQKSFQNHYGVMSKLYIVGFIVSPHIIAARVKLTHEQKSLWDLPDDLDEQKKEPSVYPSELLKSSKVVLQNEEVTLLASKCNRTIVSGNCNEKPTETIPSNSRGRSCHIVLGTVKNAPARNINYDIPFAVYRENCVVQKYPDEVRPYELPRSLLRRIGKYWFIYLKESIVVNGFFATCCAAENNMW